MLKIPPKESCNGGFAITRSRDIAVRSRKLWTN